MKSKLLTLLAMGALSTSMMSCNGSVGVTTGYTSGYSYYDCVPIYDWAGYYLYDDCGYYYYNADGSKLELDISSEVADVETAVIEKTAAIYAEKFSLSNDQAMKIAKNVNDFNALNERTENDIAEFAQKLYGVNPSEVVSAVANAQVGLNSQLDAVIDKAAINFNTSSENMRAIVKELHTRALEDSGISL